MNYITSTIFEGSWAKRLHGKEDQYTLTFEPGVNILIGPNGSGKSSVVRGIIKSSTLEHVTVKCKTEARLPLHSFDFEKDNPRVTSINQGTAAAFAMGVNSRFRSHGEVTRTMQRFLADPEVENRLLLLDEPEQALDLKGMIDLIKLLTDTKASQVIIATHAPELVLHQSFHVIELKKGYQEKVRKHIKRLIS